MHLKCSQLWSEFSQLWKIHPTQVRAGNRAELKEEVTIKIRGTLYSLAFQKGNILSHWHRNEKLSPEMWFCSQIPLFSKNDWEGCLFPTSQSQHYNQGTGYMKLFKRNDEYRLVWQQPAETLDSSSTCKAQNTSQDKAASRKGVHLLPTAGYFPSVVLPDS